MMLRHVAVALAAVGLSVVDARVPLRRRQETGTAYEPYINATFSNVTDVTLQISTADTSARNDTAP